MRSRIRGVLWHPETHGARGRSTRARRPTRDALAQSSAKQLGIISTCGTMRGRLAIACKKTGKIWTLPRLADPASPLSPARGPLAPLRRPLHLLPQRDPPPTSAAGRALPSELQLLCASESESGNLPSLELRLDPGRDGARLGSFEHLDQAFPAEIQGG